MKKFILLSIMLSAASSTVISCGSPPKKETSGSTTIVIEDVNFDASPKNTTLYLGIQSKWEGSSELTSHGACTLTSLSQPEVLTNCDIKVPEGQLHYSDIAITIGSKMPEVCAMVSFTAYYYRISNSDSYYPPGATEPIKCATNGNNLKDCWGGAAPLIYGDFPKTGGQYFRLANMSSTSIIIPSANSKALGHNRGTTNNLVDRATGISGVYVGGSMIDYYVTCEDLWAHPIYAFKLRLLEEDTKNADGTYDEIEDWQ